MLFISSIGEYMSSIPASNMLIDDSPSETKVKLSFDIEFTKVPCNLLHVDNQDVLGFNAVSYLQEILNRKICKTTS